LSRAIFKKPSPFYAIHPFCATNAPVRQPLARNSSFLYNGAMECQPSALRPASDRTLLIGASLSGLLRLLQIALAAALVVILTRNLSLAEYGVWAALGIIGSLAMVTSGIGARLCNELTAGGQADGDACRSRLFLAVFSVSAFFCWVLGGLILLLSPWIPWRAVLGHADPALFDLACRGFLAALLIQLLGMPFVLAAFGWRAFQKNVAVALLSPLATAGSLAIIVLFLGGSWRWRFVPLSEAWPLFRPLLADSISFSLLAFALGFLLQSLTFLTSRRLGYGAAGGLDVYVRIYAVALVGFGETLQPLWPAYAARRAAGDWPGIRRQLRASLAGAAGLSLAAAAGGALLAPWLVRLLTGRTITQPGPVLLLLGLWLLFGTLIQALQMFLNAFNATRVQLLTAMVLLAVLPAASGRLASAWGRCGTLAAVVFSLALLLLVMAWRVRAEFNKYRAGD
jgi:O-antigen/teichoic acid export membrane protein